MATPIGFQKDTEGYWIAKDPNVSKDYSIDYTKWLTDGNVLASVVFDVPAPLIKENEGIIGNKAFVEISGGVAGENYLISAHIDTTQAITDDQSFRLVIKDN